MDNETLTTRLRRAVDGVAPPPGYAETVTRGARRRQRRRHAASGLLSAAAVVAAGVVVVAQPFETSAPSGTSQTPVQDGTRWLTDPTHGDLAQDNLVDQAVAAWRAHLPNSPNNLADEVRGEPHVYWLGSTPLGPLAVVAQRQGDGAALGLIGFDDGAVTVLSDAPALSSVVGVGFQISGADHVLVVPDPGVPLLVSDGLRPTGGGTLARTWQPLEMDDGLALLAMPEGVDASAVRVARAAADGTPTRDQVMLLPQSRAQLGFDQQSKYRVEHRLDWPQTVFRLPGSTPPPLQYDEFLVKAGLTDPYVRMAAGGFWTVATVLPDGRPVWVTEYQEDSSPSRLFAIIGTDGATVVDGGPVDPSEVLPVRVRLPDGNGWVVADNGSTLSYRTGPDAAWVDAGTDAAHLPDAATEVAVAKGGLPPVLVTL